MELQKTKKAEVLGWYSDGRRFALRLFDGMREPSSWTSIDPFDGRSVPYGTIVFCGFTTPRGRLST